MEAEFLRVDAPARIYFVADGEEAIAFLLRTEGHEHAPRPAMIFLDLKLANGGGLEMLTMAKRDQRFARIPILVFSTAANGDVDKAYGLRANCCIRKPDSREDLIQFVSFIKHFWFEMLTLPT